MCGMRVWSKPIVGSTTTPAAATRSSRSSVSPGPPSAMPLKCSIPSTPPARAASIPATEWACARTRRPTSCAASTITRRSSAAYWAPNMSVPAVRKPPLAITLITSTPRSWWSATAARSSSWVAAVQPRKWQCPPGVVIGGPAATDPRLPRRRAVAERQRPVVTVAEVHDRRHAVRGLRGQRPLDLGVDLLGRHRARPVRASPGWHRRPGARGRRRGRASACRRTTTPRTRRAPGSRPASTPTIRSSSTRTVAPPGRKREPSNAWGARSANTSRVWTAAGPLSSADRRSQPKKTWASAYSSGLTSLSSAGALDQRHPDDVLAAQRDHDAEVAVGDGADRLQPEAGGEPPVERGRRAAPLHVAEHDRARLRARALLDLLGDPVTDAAEPDVAERVELAALPASSRCRRAAPRPRRRPGSARTWTRSASAPARRPRRCRTAARG